MFRDVERRSLVRAARSFQSLDGHKTLHAMAALAGLKRLQDAFAEHVTLVRGASEGVSEPGIALFWVPAQFRGAFTTSVQVEAACHALETENPSLRDSLTVLWPGAPDSEVKAAWSHLEGLDWSTHQLVGVFVAARDAAQREAGIRRDEAGTSPLGCIDVVGETYEMLKSELKLRAGSAQGEFFTPENVVWMMVKMQDPQPGKSVLDPCCGSGRMLVLAAAHLIQKHGLRIQETPEAHPLGAGHRLVVPPAALLVGQDLMPHGPAMGRISLTALGYLNAVLVVRDSLRDPVTMEEVHAVVRERAAALLALQAGHLVTPDLVLDAPGTAGAGGVAATARGVRDVAAPSLDSFGEAT